MKVKNQHYVPRGLLNNFVDENNKITVLDLKKNAILVDRSTKSYCVEKNTKFYDDVKFARKADGQVIWVTDEQMLEHLYGKCENTVIPLIRDIAKDSTVYFKDGNSNKILSFIFDLAMRTKEARNEYELCEQINADTYSKFEMAYNSQLSAKECHNYHQVDLKQQCKEIERCLLFYNIYLAINLTKEPFILSDDPAYGLRMGLNDVCVPLMPTLAIIFRNANGPHFVADVKIGDGIAELDAKQVVQYNLLQMTGRQYVIGTKLKLESYKLLNSLMNSNVHNHENCKSDIDSINVRKKEG